MIRASARSLPILAIFAVGGLAACAPVTDAPSLARRPAEAIDPRIPIVDRSAVLPADPALASALQRITQPAFAQASAVDAAIARAAALAVGAGASGSESWIAAQQQLSAAVAAQAPITRAIGEFDAVVSERIRSGSRLVPQDLAAVQAISSELAAMDRRQRFAIAEVQARLSR